MISSNINLLLIICLFSTIASSTGEMDKICPGSPARRHASCQMIVTFPESPCSAVQSEISSRLTSTTWIDPHNQGVYTQLESSYSENGAILIKAKRLTGDKKYTDLFNFLLEDSPGSSSCIVRACSESQVFSVLDFSTNYCNLRNLYCNSDDGCVPIQHNLKYKEEYTNCGQRGIGNCIVSKSDG
mmetsp:Transcript_994/g.1259  ORF Transcript_994/g.1259 Transcript_994/m.1259 type:complete len:185 (+) Transcript_994:78-632(+)